MCVSLWMPRVLGFLFYLVTFGNFELELRDVCLTSLNVLSQELWVGSGLEKRKIHNEG